MIEFSTDYLDEPTIYVGPVVEVRDERDGDVLMILTIEEAERMSANLIASITHAKTLAA